MSCIRRGSGRRCKGPDVFTQVGACNVIVNSGFKLDGVEGGVFGKFHRKAMMK